MKAFITFILLTITYFGYGQHSIIVKGKIVDSETNITLPGALVYFHTSNKSAITNEFGKFECSIKKGWDSVFVSYLGYKDYSKKILISNDTLLHIELTPNAVEISKVVVTKQKNDDNIQQTNLGKVSLSNESIRALPALMGEPDVIRALASSGGITQIEGMQGIYVRGGSQEQNLILIDGATIYNPSHLLGFFSVFNSDIISSAELYKSGVPAKYGGRLSSVLDISTLQANPKKIESSISLGILSSRIMCNVPITKKSAIRFSYRKTYLNLFVMPLIEKTLKTNEDLSTAFGFYDATLNYNYRPNERNHFSFSMYYGNDKFEMENPNTLLKNTVTWGNNAISGKWNHFGKNNWGHTVTVSHSEYSFDFSAKQSYYKLTIGTGITNNEIHYITKKQFENHTISLGSQMQLQNFNTGTINASLNNEPFQNIPPLISRSVEAAFFAEDKYKLTENIIFEGGIRIIPYAHIGPATTYTYNDKQEITDTIYFDENDILYKNIGIEPRLQAKYLLSSESSIKASISRNTQHLHMVSMLSAALPADIWMPASNDMPRVTGMQYNIGYFKDFNEHTYQSSISVFYKNMNNIIEFKDGFITLYSSSFNQKLARGKGFACGTEFTLKKTQGKLQGGISYNFSRTLRKFSEINNGYLYPASYDKPHDFSIQLQYEFSKKLHISALWVYSSGKVYSEPISRYFINKNLISEYGAINNNRMQAYHRMDIGADYTIFTDSKFDVIFQTSIYNVYNRDNTYYIYYETIGDLNKFYIELIKNEVGLFPILPSISLQMIIK